MHMLSRGLRTTTGPAPRRPGQHLWRLALLAFALLAALGATGAMAQPASADDRPPGGVLSDPVVRAVDIAEPSVVRIATLFTVDVSINLCGASLADTGHVGDLGSGAYVSADGDILTADHVVHISTDDLNAAEVYPALIPVIDKVGACKGFSDAHQATVDDVAALAAQGFVTTHYSLPTFDIFRSSAYLGTLNTSGDSQFFLNTLLAAPHATATVVASSPFEQDDLALLHVAETDTPSIQLDDSASVAVQDTLTIVGFPGNADLPLAEVPGEPDLGGSDPTNAVTPSVNTILVSAIKRNADGAQLIQVGGNVEHGDSGAPALDAAGHIVGVVSFGGTDFPDGTSFLRSSGSAKALMAQANINTQPGPFQRAWEQAFTDYAASDPGHWHRAAAELDALSLTYPAFHAVTPYKTYADTAASHESVSAASIAPSLSWLIPGAIGLGVLLLIVVGILLLLGRRRTPPTPPAAHNGANGYGPPPSYPGQRSAPYPEASSRATDTRQSQPVALGASPPGMSHPTETWTNGRDRWNSEASGH